MYNARKYKTKSEGKESQIYSLFRRNNVVIGTYEGGDVKFGTLIGTVDKFLNLDFIYQEVREDNQMISGKGFVQPFRKNQNVLNLFRTSSLRSNRKTSQYLYPL